MPSLTSRKSAQDSLRLLRVLQILFRAQAREVSSRLSVADVESNRVPDLTHWVRETARVAQPLILEMWQRGMLRTQAQLSAKLGGEPRGLLDRVATDLRRTTLPTADIFTPKMWTGRVRAILKARARPQPSPSPRPKPGLDLDFDIYNPRVLDAVDDAVMRFCRETNETAVQDLQTSVRKLRALLKRGLKRGDAVAYLAKRVRQIFADPMRAFRIAVTESSRAVHTGALYAAKESGVVVAKTWLASSDACEKCLELDGKTVPLDQPFFIDPRGGPYAVVMTPPLHPHCFCDMTQEIG